MLLDPFEDRREALATWLREILQTPLPSGARLADLPQQDTLRAKPLLLPHEQPTGPGSACAHPCPTP